MWDWIPEEERRVMADVFAMEDARNRRREEEKLQKEKEPEPEPKKSTGFPGSIYAPPGVYTSTTYTSTRFPTGKFK